MKTTVKLLSAALVAILVLLCAVPSVFAGTASKSVDEALYTNPETGFQAVILDEAGLLGTSEKDEVLESMKPLTSYGHVAFWSTEEYDSNALDQARRKRLELFEYDDAAILAINMNVRKINLQSYGAMYNVITDSYARSITDNASGYASKGDYCGCAVSVYRQAFKLFGGESISEPMKYISYAVIAVMVGVLFAVGIAFSQRHNALRRTGGKEKIDGNGTLVVPGTFRQHIVKTETGVIVSHSGGGGCGGGSSCGGGGGCGGGGCGGGGGSSF